MKDINFKYYNDKNIYNDGLVENELFEHYENGVEIDKNREDIFFYTTDIRENIVSWYPFDKDNSVLEIGAGLGTITSFLCENCGRVVAVEGSKRRAEVIASRHKDRKNLEIYCANFNDIKFEEKFDYIVLIGVFEYAKIFCNTDNPFYDFLQNIKKLLKDNGKILIAIENRYGLKYWLGLSEDHIKKPYAGLTGYDKSSFVQTFGKEELDSLFEKSGFKTRKFYYLFPDYKVPEVIYTDNKMPSRSEVKQISHYNYYSDLYTASPEDVMRGIIDNKQVDFFANSFLVELSTLENNACDVDFVKFQNRRSENYQVVTTLYGNKIRKYAKNDLAKKHLENLKNTHKILLENNIRCCEIFDDYSIEFIEGKTVLEIIQDYVNNNDFDSAKKVIQEYYDYLLSISKVQKLDNPYLADMKKIWKEANCLPLGLFDLHMDNVIKDKEGIYVLIDQEWVTSKQLPIEYNLYIAFNVLYNRVPKLNDAFSIYDLYNQYNISDDIITVIEKARSKYFLEDNILIDDEVNTILNKNTSVNYVEDVNKKNNELQDACNHLNELQNKLNNEIENLNVQINQLKEDNNNLLNSNNEMKLQNESYVLVIDNLKDNVNELENNVSLLENNKIQLENDINNRNDTINVMQHELDIANNDKYNYSLEINKLLSSRCWRITAPLRFVSKKVMLMKKLIKKFVVKFLRVVYKYFPLPMSFKRRVLDSLERKFSFVKRVRRSNYNKTNRMLVDNSSNVMPFGNVVHTIDKKVAVHAHMYYVDLAEEFFNYLNNIPYSFDLYVSVSKKENIKIIKDKFNNINNLDKLVVKTCQNVGRDFSPMFVEFGNDLKKYDYVCHIHTKKSVRTGSEQDGWRNHLIGSVLGSTDLIKNIFYQFESNSDVGLIFPETYCDMPYWAHTYLQNRHNCRVLADKFEIGLPEEYFDYSVGSIFWARGNSLKKIFDMNLSYSDFGTEEGKNDGTFAHAIERMLPSAVMSMGYKYLIVDINKQCFKNTSDKNLWQYCNMNYKDILLKVKGYKEITFDIFDTLLTRMVYNPSDVMDLIEEHIKTEGIIFEKFKETRANAEYNVRVKNKFLIDVTIDDIYNELKKITNFTKEQLDYIKQIEKEFEVKFCVPRKDMLNLFNELKRMKKKIYLISDMYLDSDTITKMLNKCGYYGWDELIVSCEVNKRKDNGTMWDYFFENHSNTLHFGDNEASDIQAVCDRGHDFVHVMQGKRIFTTTKYGQYLSSDLNNISNADKVILGSVINKVMCNSPFRKDFNVVVDNYKDFGYCFMGPLFLKFFLWLNEETTKNGNEKLLFLAREGYFFEKLYQDFCDLKGVKSIDHEYFLASRRAVSVAAIKDINDVEELLKRYYKGSLKNLFSSRFGYEIDCEDENIELPNDYEKVLKIFNKFSKDYFKSISKEKIEYKKYAKKVMANKKKIAVVDLGYSGSIQYYLSKLMDYKYDGYYFILDANVFPRKIGCNVYNCYDIENKQNYEDCILWYSLILESFLTAPYGQLVNFENGKPIYKDDIISEEQVKNLEMIYDGVKEFMSDIINLKSDITSDDIDNKIICKNFASLVQLDNIISEELENEFVLEDKYCSDEISNVLKLLKSRR